MGPYQFSMPSVATYTAELAAAAPVKELTEDERWLVEYRAAHPEAIVTQPAHLHRGYFEVSLPGRAAMAFSTIEMMRKALGWEPPQ